MSDPFSRNNQALTDALLHIDQSISAAEANIAVALQLQLPEAQDLAMRLPKLIEVARSFLANVPDMGQPQRWGEGRRLLEQARRFDNFFAPYLALGPRITAFRQAIQDQDVRKKASAEAAEQARLQDDVEHAAELVRRRVSDLRRTLADMQMQRGAGFEDPAWLDAVRAVGSILSAQDTRFAGAMVSVRSGDFAAAQPQLDQTLGELQAGLDLAQRARAGASARAQNALLQIGVAERVQSVSEQLVASTLGQTQPIRIVHPVPNSLLLIEARSGTLFRLDARPTIIGRGLDPGTGSPGPYLDLSRACDPGEAEDLGVSRRHCEIALQEQGFAVRDLGSTNGTRMRLAGQNDWFPLVAQQWQLLHDGDVLNLGLLQCSVSIS